MRAGGEMYRLLQLIDVTQKERTKYVQELALRATVCSAVAAYVIG